MNVSSATPAAGPSPRRRRSRIGLGLAAAASVGAAMLTMAGAGTASADTGPVRLMTAPDPTAPTVVACLDSLAASTANFTPVQVYGCNTTAAQRWIEVEAGSTIRLAAAPGKCLDVQGGGTADGTKVDLYDCNGTGAQVWIPQSNGSLYNPQSNKCLDDTGRAHTSVQVQIWDCAGSQNQRWTAVGGMVGRS